MSEPVSNYVIHKPTRNSVKLKITVITYFNVPTYTNMFHYGKIKTLLTGTQKQNNLKIHKLQKSLKIVTR